MFCHDGSDPCERCKDEQKIRSLYERYRAYMERIARGDSYGATLAREALGGGEPSSDAVEIARLRALLASLAKDIEGAMEKVDGLRGPHPSTFDAEVDGSHV